MSKVVIAASTDKTDAVGDLRRHLPGKSVADILGALSTGAPLVDRTLFYNDHDEAAVQLQGVVAELQKHGIEPRVYELDDDEDWDALIDSDKQESVEYLENILARHEQIKADRERRGE